MTTRLTASLISTNFPRVSRLMGEKNVAGRIQQLDWFGSEFIHQIECDLDFLAQRVPEPQVSAAYRPRLKNPDLIPALYEIRAAAMLANVSSEVTLEPPVGPRHADVLCVIGSHRVFVEVTTWVDKWPPPPKSIGVVEWYDRAIVERSFNPQPRSYDPRYRDVPASQPIRDRIKDKRRRQLPNGELGLIVLGAPYAEWRDLDAALFGDGCVDFTAREGAGPPRVKNGLFAIPDDVGGVSRIGGLVWLNLVRAGAGYAFTLDCSVIPWPPIHCPRRWNRFWRASSTAELCSGVRSVGSRDASSTNTTRRGSFSLDRWRPSFVSRVTGSTNGAISISRSSPTPGRVSPIASERS